MTSAAARPSRCSATGSGRARYGGSTAVIGKTISLDGKAHLIVGVTDPSFFGVNVGESIQVYTPLCLRPGLEARSNWFLRVIGRPKPGVTPSQVASRFAAIAPAVFEATVPQQWGAAERRGYVRKNTLGVRPAANGLSCVRKQYQRP